MKEDPGPIQLDTLLAEIVKLERVKAVKLPEGLFEAVSEKVVAGWRARAIPTLPSRASTVAKISSLARALIVVAMSLSVRNAGSS